MINKSSFIQSLKSCNNILAGESTRLGGNSKHPFESLNLGLFTADDAQLVSQNRRHFFDSLDIPPEQVAGSHQIHSDKILHVDRPGQFEGFDALMTDRKGIFLTVTVADCTPILIYDQHNEVVAAVHAGWKGTALRIVGKTLNLMGETFGSIGENCFAYIGTCIDECSFEVDADVADHFNEHLKRWDEQNGKFFVDLKTANKNQLLEFGIPESQIEVSAFSTYVNNDRFFSYRKEKGQTGRMLAVIGMRG